MLALSILPALDNSRHQPLSNSPILLLAHLWFNATRPIMNQTEITLLSKRLSDDFLLPTPNVSKFLPFATIHEAIFTSYRAAKAPFFVCREDFHTRARGEAERVSRNDGECKISLHFQRADAAESQCCNKMWEVQQFEMNSPPVSSWDLIKTETTTAS